MRKIILFFLVLPLFFFIKTEKTFAQNPKVILNEIMWGSDSDGEEWIELKNMTNTEIDISNWSIDNAKSSNNTLLIKNGKIPANGYFLICKNNSKKDYCDYYDAISLNNNYKDNGKLILRDQEKTIIDSTQEASSNNWPAGKSSGISMQRVIENGQVKNQWQDGNPPTPQGSGIELEANAGSSIVTLTLKEIVLDGSKSKGSIVEYIWNLGDGNILSGEKVSYRYQFPGRYLVSLTVSDGRNKKTDFIEVTVFSDSIFLSEFSLKNKWIEIKNTSGIIQDISGWGLSDNKDKVKFVFPEGSFIAPNSYLVINKDLVGSLVKSNGGTLYFFYPNGDIRTQVDYQGFDGSIARKGNDYFYTIYETPGAENIIYNKENIGKGGGSESLSAKEEQKEGGLEEENKNLKEGSSASEPKRIGVLSEEKKAKESEPFLSKNLLSEVKKAKSPLLFGSFAVILFSGSVGTVLARLRRKLKNKNHENLQKIEVEIEK